MNKLRGFLLLLMIVFMTAQFWGCASGSHVKPLFPPAEKPQDAGEQKPIPQQQDEPSQLVVEHETDEALSLEAELGNKKIGPLNFDGEKLPGVFDIISSMTGLNFKIDKTLMNTEVTIFIRRDTSLITAIEMLCYKYGLAYDVNPDFISIKKSKQGQVSPLEEKLANITVGALDFQDEKLSNVLKVISSLTGVNFVVKSPLFGKTEIKKGEGGNKADEDENQNQLLNRKITIFLKDVSLKTALDVLCKQYSLVYNKVGEKYIRIRDEVEDLTGAIRMSYYDIRPDGTVKEVKEGAVNMSEGKIHVAVKGGILVQVLNEISMKSGKNIVCRGDLDYTFVEIYITNVPVITAIEAICKKYGLWYEENKEKNYICLMKAGDFADQASLDFKIKTMVFNLKHASAPQLADSIASVMGNRVEYVLPTNLRSYEHLKEPNIEEEEAKIQAKKSDADVTKNIETPELQNITAEKIGALLGTKLDLKLTAQDIRRINKQVGFAIISIFLRNNTIIVSSTDDVILQEIGDLIDKLDTPTPQILIECRILKTTLTDDFTSFFQLTNFAHREKGGDSYGEDTKTWTAPIFGAAGANAFYNFVDDKWKLDLQMKLLKKDGIINIIGTPMIVAAQNSQAILETGLKNFPLFNDVDVIPPAFDDEGNISMQGYTTPRYKTVELVGTSLKITPQINEDKSVTLKIYVTQSSINKGAATIQYSAFDADGNPVTPWASTNVDVLSENSVNTIAVVPESHTLAIGGLVTEKDMVVENKVPFLGDIPIIGFFFKDHQTIKERTEMVFLLTPHIIMAPEETGVVTEKALKGLEHPSIRDRKRHLFEYDEKWKKLRRK